MPYCPHCGKKYSEGDRFCEGCGRELVSAIPRSFRKSYVKKWRKLYIVRNFKALFILGIAILILLLFTFYDSSDIGFYTSHPNLPTKHIFGAHGAFLSGILFLFFGKSVYILPIFLLSYVVYKFSKRNLLQFQTKFIITTIILLIFSLSTFLSLFTKNGDSGGLLGICFAPFLIHYIGHIGAYITIFGIFILSLLFYIFRKRILKIVGNLLLFILTILILISTTLSIESSLFNVHTVTTTNIHGFLENEKEFIENGIKGTNIFELNLSEISYKIKENYPALSEIVVVRRLPNEIIINIKNNY